MAKKADPRDMAGKNDVRDILGRLGLPDRAIFEAVQVVPLMSSKDWRGMGYHWEDVVKVIEKYLKTRMGTLEFDISQYQKKINEAESEHRELGQIASRIPSNFPS